MADLVGVQDCAAAVGRAKGTISKHAASGKIPVAGKDDRGNPLFDVEQVRQAYENNINPLMRRRGEAVSASNAEPELEADPEEDERSAVEQRRSWGASHPAAPVAGSGLLKHQVVERQLRNRRLIRQIAEDEGRLVLRAVVDSEQATMARRTRDAVTAFLADRASTAYAFAGQSRTEAEWRVWLVEQGREAFNHFASTLSLEGDDEFGDERSDDGDAGEAGSAAVP
jgi:hypothetical protein